MNRRSFLASLAALPFAGAAIEKLAAMRPQLPLWVRHSGVTTTGRFSHITLQKAYRKIQQAAMEGFQYESEEWDLFDEPKIDVHAPSGFRAWSARFDS